MTIYLLNLDWLFLLSIKSLQWVEFFIADFLRIILFKGLVENSIFIPQTAGGLVQANSLGEIRQDQLLVTWAPSKHNREPEMFWSLRYIITSLWKVLFTCSLNGNQKVLSWNTVRTHYYGGILYTSYLMYLHSQVLCIDLVHDSSAFVFLRPSNS